MGAKGRNARIKLFSRFIVVFAPLLILYKALGRVFDREVEGINFLMMVITIITCLFYNKLAKREKGFIFVLYFISLLLDNTFIHIISYYETIDRTVPILLILRGIIITLIMMKTNKVVRYINKNKIVVFIIFTLINLLVLVTNKTTSKVLYSSCIFSVFLVASMITIVIITIVSLIKSFKKKREFIDQTFLCSLSILVVRRVLMVIENLLGLKFSWFFDEKWVFCFALYIIPISLFVEYSCMSKEKRELEERVKVISHSMKEYKEIDKLRTQFFANISHEMKTPINIIFSGIQLIESRKDEGDEVFIDYYNKYSPMIKQNCLRIIRLTNNLVDMTKFDAGFMKMNFINVDIVSLVEDIVMSVAEYVKNKNINIIFDTLIEEKVIKCDKDGIERIILNLISNAIKFTPKDGNILVFMEEDSGFVIIRVKDDGTGIPKENREKVFNVFVQGDKNLNRAREGSGIGLSLVKAIVEQHGGEVKCADVEVGTEIVLKLPDIVLEDESIQHKISSFEDSMIKKINIEFSDIYEL